MSAAGSTATLRISGERGIGPVLSRADLRSVRADVDPHTAQPDILLALSPNGQRRLVALMRNALRASRRRHHPVHILIYVNGKVISKQYIDYHTFGNPLPAAKGILVDVTSTREAHDLAAGLNG